MHVISAHEAHELLASCGEWMQRGTSDLARPREVDVVGVLEPIMSVDGSEV